jgi:DNA mismatch repair protein MutS
VASGNALPRDLVAIREITSRLPEIRKSLPPSEPVLSPIYSGFFTCEDVYDFLSRSIAEEPPATLQNIGVIRSGYSSELDNTIEMSRHAREWISNLEGLERERTGIKTLKVGFNKVFGYYIEITHSNTQQAPSEYIRKQTLVNAERYITPEMKEYESLVLNAEERIREIENRLFKEICVALSKFLPQILETASAIAHLDVFSSFAEVASLSNYVLPELLSSMAGIRSSKLD